MTDFFTLGRLGRGDYESADATETVDVFTPAAVVTITTDMPSTRVLKTDRGMEVETTMSDDEAAQVIESHRGEDEFADKMAAEYRRFGRLFPNKLAWMHRKAMDFIEKDMGGPDTVSVAGKRFARLFELFGKASKLKYPTITFQLDRSRLVLTFKRDGRFANTISLSSGPKSAGGRWYGSIQADGTLAKGYVGLPAEAVELLERLNEDPTTAIAKHGKKTGKCCYCNTPLTDATSVQFGYGETCAKHYGQPYGVTAAKRLGLAS